GVVAALLTAVQDGARTGVAAVAATPATADAWALPTTPDPGRIAVHNPGAEEAVVTVEVAGQRPDGWGDVAVPPNGRVAFDVAEVGAAGPASVVADRAVVAGVVAGQPDGPAPLWADVG